MFLNAVRLGRLSAAVLIALSLTLVVAAAPQKNGKKAGRKANPSPGAPAPTMVADTASPESAPSESDPQRSAWRVDVTPAIMFGSGHPGKGAADFDKPDGVAFTPDGKLLATDAKNHRIQVWDVKTGARIGEFGHGVFGGEVVDIAVLPNGIVLVTDQVLDLAYAFEPPKPGALDEETKKPLGPADYQFVGTKFGEQGFDKLGGIAVDSKSRIYCIDAHLDEVRRFGPDFKPDPSWHFEKTRANGDPYLHGCEGVAIDEADGGLYVSSERDAVVQVFDLETGAYKHRLVGALGDAAGVPGGKHVFFGSVEGLAITNGYLLAVDESAGHIQLFDLRSAGAFGTDLASYPIPRVGRDKGYLGFIGHAPKVDFDDKTNAALQKSVKDETIIPGQANPPGYFCSPDSIAVYTEPASQETYVAVADQCNFRVAVYRWSDVIGALRRLSVRLR